MAHIGRESMFRGQVPAVTRVRSNSFVSSMGGGRSSNSGNSVVIIGKDTFARASDLCFTPAGEQRRMSRRLFTTPNGWFTEPLYEGRLRVL